MKTILLYYKFVQVSNPQQLRDEQFALCQRLNLKGRILIANEGLNGTLAGNKEDCEVYMRETEKSIGDLEWKISTSEREDLFPKLKVKVRPEIVTFGFDVNIDHKANYIEPEELKSLYRRNEDFIILDGRNEYEGRVGRFKNSIVPDIKNFRDFPRWFEENREIFEGKKVITYCTGGIRCEKLSAFLVDKGVDNVYQLHGGIHKYAEVTGGENFEGEMYVFDSRIHIPVNYINPNIISHCHHCGTKVARFKNCRNNSCNEQIIICEDCEKKFNGCCSRSCLEKLSITAQV
jgi:UPF0176 protein